MAYAFSADGTMYSIRWGAAGRSELFSRSVADWKTEKTIGPLAREYMPLGSRRLTLTPDGKSLTYSTAKPTSNLWLMEGLDAVPLP